MPTAICIPVRCAKARALLNSGTHDTWRIDMGKYILGWLLGVPAVVLVIIYLLFN